MDLFLVHSDNAPPHRDTFSLLMGNGSPTLGDGSASSLLSPHLFNAYVRQFSETERHLGVASINMLMQEHQYADTASTLCQLVLLFNSSSLAEWEIKMRAKCLNIHPDKTAERPVGEETSSESMAEIILTFWIIESQNTNFRHRYDLKFSVGVNKNPL